MVDLVVFSAAQAGLPAFVGAPRGPAADGHQHGAQVSLAAFFGDAHAFQRCRDQCLRRNGQTGQLLAQRGMAVAPGQAVVGSQLLAPAVQQALGVVHAPGGLVAVEVRRAMLADLVRHQVGPAQAGSWRCHAVTQVGHQRQARQRRRLALQRRHQPGHLLSLRSLRCLVVCGLLVSGREVAAFSRHSRLQVLLQEPACGPLRAEPVARHGQPRAGQGTQRGSSFGHGAAYPAPVRVDGDEFVQRPGGRHTRRSAVDVINQALRLQHGGVDDSVHARDPAGVVSMAMLVSVAGRGAVDSVGPGGRHRLKAMRLNFSSRNSPP